MRIPQKEIIFLTKIERHLALGCAIALVPLWFLGEHTAGNGVYADDAMRSPIVGGTPILLLVVAIVIFNAWFIAAETALIHLRSAHAKQLKDDDLQKSDRPDTVAHRFQAKVCCRLHAW